MKSGILPICKPEGISSAKVVHLVKKISHAKKTGHMGTLDPFATGLLLCGIDKGTRISKFFLNGSKRYKAKICLGIETDTFDCTGSVVQKIESLDHISQEEIFEIIDKFKGKQMQEPPAYSALKHKGKPLYKYAREGEKIIKPAREIEIFEISIEKIDFPFVEIDVLCSAGTYIRTIAYDMGRKLGCGAHLSNLCRTQSSAFKLEDAIPLDVLETLDQTTAEQRIIGLSDCLEFMPEIVADNRIAKKIKFGQTLLTRDLEPPLIKSDQSIKVIDHHNDLLAIIQLSENRKAYKYSCVFSS